MKQRGVGKKQEGAKKNKRVLAKTKGCWQKQKGAAPFCFGLARMLVYVSSGQMIFKACFCMFSISLISRLGDLTKQLTHILLNMTCCSPFSPVHTAYEVVNVQSCQQQHNTCVLVHLCHIVDSALQTPAGKLYPSLYG